jgi:hypothetical protein
MKPVCKACTRAKDSVSGTWWHLSGYHGFSGLFCPDCFDKVSHDVYGKPNHPQEVEAMRREL